jgi:uncharacterized phage-associated protein
MQNLSWWAIKLSAFRFDARKAAQAANKMLRLSGGRRNYMELIKLLYLADRAALLKLERPITGDCVVALKHGLVLSHVLDLIKWGPCNEEDAPWFDTISAPDGYDVKSLAELDDGELSGAEVRVLEEVFAEYGKKDWKELSRLTHELPEWDDPGDGRIPVGADEILKLNGRSTEEIERISEEASAYDRLDRDVSVFVTIQPTGFQMIRAKASSMVGRDSVEP